MHGDFSNWQWGFGFGHWGFGIVFWIAVLVLVVVLIRKFTTAGTCCADGEDPIEILKRRYARGEIDKQEFETRKRDLKS